MVNRDYGENVRDDDEDPQALPAAPVLPDVLLVQEVVVRMDFGVLNMRHPLVKVGGVERVEVALP